MPKIPSMTEAERLNSVTSSRLQMEELSERLRLLIGSQPPEELLGYLYSRRLLGAMRDEGGVPGAPLPVPLMDKDAINQSQFVLEYVHAVWAASPSLTNGRLDESRVHQILQIAEELRAATMSHCIFSSAGTEGGAFGDATRDVEFTAKSTWVLLRGNRYQVLEEEFFTYVLAPHDDALRRVYGVSSKEIAAGFQRMADAVRTGHMRAVAAVELQMASAMSYAAAHGGDMEDAVKIWRDAEPEAAAAATRAFQDLFQGGICNMSWSSGLPEALLADLAYRRGEDQEFFAPGEYRGTPLRTLPARKKPLITLESGQYAPDPCFIRDAGYRALLWNLLRRAPEYKAEFKDRQQSMSESAFVDILGPQLAGAQVFRNVWYKDVQNRQWVENDLLVLLDDALILVEAKAGAAASIASPALDFARHVQSVQDLVVKAYTQCRRFFDYLTSADEVPIFARDDDRYVEVERLRRKDFRVALPIGLTVESFSPFSAMCKELPGIEPLLGAHAFISLSIDDLFVLGRFLPTAGELLHYLEVRQHVAGLRMARLFDEVDHLGAYIRRNRFDSDLQAQLAEGADLVTWDGMSDVVDRHFEGDDWATRAVPTQPCPAEVRDLLACLDRTRAPGWLGSDSAIRDYGGEGREDLAVMLTRCRSSLAEHESRYFCLGASPSLFVWLQRSGTTINTAELRIKAAAAQLAGLSTEQIVLVAHASSREGYVRVERDTSVNGASEIDQSLVFSEAEQLRARMKPLPKLRTEVHRHAADKLPGRNERCWCGSGRKFKKCHGAKS